MQQLIAFLTPQHQVNCMQIFRNKKLLYLYGDPAYRATFGVIGPYREHAYLNREQLKFNKAMAEVRIAIEQGFGLTQKQWSHTSFALAMKTGLQPVAAYYFTGILLTNCYTCIRSNQISAQFLLSPPSLEYYLGGIGPSKCSNCN